MARKLHYQACFKSRDGYTYGVCLIEEGYTGNQIVQLVPAENPFETREEDDENVFTPVRAQWGYIRVIDTDNTIFDQIVPPNNFSLLVRVWRGSYYGIWPNGQFSAVTLVWQGFVQSQIYTQPWTEHQSVLELPVKSMLGTLRTLYMPNGPMRIMPLRELLTLASEQLDVPNLWNNTIFNTDWMANNVFWNVYVMTAALQNEVTYISTLNQKTVEYEGLSFYEILQKVAQLFGMTIRENGQTLYFEQLQIAGSATGKKVSFSRFSESTPQPTDESFVSSSLDTQFERTANMKSLMQGARSVKVSLSIDVKKFSIISLPEAQEDQTAVDVVNVYGVGTSGYKRLFIQVPMRQSDPNTTYQSRLYNQWKGNYEVFWPCPDYNPLGESYTAISVGSTTNPIQIEVDGEVVWHTAIEKDVAWYNNVNLIWHDGAWMLLDEYPSEVEQIIETSIAKAPLSFFGFTPYTTASGAYVDYPPNTVVWVRYGAIPVRFHLAELNEEVKLSHGVHLTLDFSNSINLMTIKSPVSYNSPGDYLNINFQCQAFAVTHPGHQRQLPDQSFEWVWDMDDWKVRVRYPSQTGWSITYNFMLKFGGKYWNGSSWQTSATTFQLEFVEGKIPNNYNQQMLVEDMGGYYIPIDDTFSGVVEFSFRGMSGQYNPVGQEVLDYQTAIVSDLSCVLLRKNQIYVSSADENNYFSNVNDKGFEDKKTIYLEMGTSNNNTSEAVNLIVNNSNIKIEQITYDDNTQQRPEQHLLEQMKNYYSQVRRVYTAWLSSYVNGKDWYKTIITYDNRKFYGIIKKKLWKQAEEEIKLIETYNPTEE